MKKILKGILLWTTALTIVLFAIGIDSIVDEGLVVTLMWIAICVALYKLCYSTLSLRDLYTLSGYKLLNTLIR